MTTMDSRPTSRWPLVADLACVLALAVGGRNSHSAGDADWVVLAIAWPFALAVGLAHAGLRAGRRHAARAWPEGAIVLAVTYVLGMVLRVISGRGLAPGFLVVAAVFLALTMLGWRGVVQLGRRHRAMHNLLMRFSDWVVAHPVWWGVGSGLVLVLLGFALDLGPIPVVAAGAVIGGLNILHARRRGYCPLPAEPGSQPGRAEVE